MEREMTCVSINANNKQQLPHGLLLSRDSLAPVARLARDIACGIARCCMMSDSLSEHQPIRIRIGNLLSRLAHCTLGGHVRIRPDKNGARHLWRIALTFIADAIHTNRIVAMLTQRVVSTASSTGRTTRCAIVLLIECLLLLHAAVSDVPIRILPSYDAWSIQYAMKGEFYTCGAGLTRYSANSSILSNWTYHDNIYMNGCTMDSAGRFYVIDFPAAFSGHVRCIDSEGIVLWKANASSPMGIAVDDKYIYYTSQVDYHLVVLTIDDGQPVREIQVGTWMLNAVHVGVDGSLYVAGLDGTFKISMDGEILVSYGSDGGNSITTDRAGNVYVADNDNFWVRTYTPDGRIKHIYSLNQTDRLCWLTGVSVHPQTGVVAIVDAQCNRIVFFEQYQPPTQCVTGPETGKIDLSPLSATGEELWGHGVNSTVDFFWSVCGAVDFYCPAISTSNVSLLAVTYPDRLCFVVARSGPPLVWSVEQGKESFILNGTIANGNPCGRSGQPARLVVLLTCASQQDDQFIVDMSGVSVDEDVCTYVLKLNTDVICPSNNSMISTI